MSYAGTLGGTGLCMMLSCNYNRPLFSKFLLKSNWNVKNQCFILLESVVSKQYVPIFIGDRQSVSWVNNWIRKRGFDIVSLGIVRNWHGGYPCHNSWIFLRMMNYAVCGACHIPFDLLYSQSTNVYPHMRRVTYHCHNGKSRWMVIIKHCWWIGSTCLTESLNNIHNSQIWLGCMYCRLKI